jgi:signal transduction histidine kinase
MPYPIDTDVEFLTKFAHEIRQPLSPMQSALQLLKSARTRGFASMRAARSSARSIT